MLRSHPPVRLSSRGRRWRGQIMPAGGRV